MMFFSFLLLTADMSRSVSALEWLSLLGCVTQRGQDAFFLLRFAAIFIRHCASIFTVSGLFSIEHIDKSIPLEVLIGVSLTYKPSHT